MDRNKKGTILMISTWIIFNLIVDLNGYLIGLGKWIAILAPCLWLYMECDHSSFLSNIIDRYNNLINEIKINLEKANETANKRKRKGC